MADGLQAGLPGAVGGAREAADVAVNSAVIERVRVADVESGRRIRNAEFGDFGSHARFERLSAGRERQRGEQSQCEFLHGLLLLWWSDSGADPD